MTKQDVEKLYRILKYNKENNIFPRNVEELAESLKLHRTAIYYAIKNQKYGYALTQLKLWLADNDKSSKYEEKLIFNSEKKEILEKYNFAKKGGEYYGNSFVEGNLEFSWYVDSNNEFKLSIYDKKSRTEILLENLGFIADLVKRGVISKEFCIIEAKI